MSLGGPKRGGSPHARPGWTCGWGGFHPGARGDTTRRGRRIGRSVRTPRPSGESVAPAIAPTRDLRPPGPRCPLARPRAPGSPRGAASAPPASLSAMVARAGPRGAGPGPRPGRCSAGSEQRAAGSTALTRPPQLALLPALLPVPPRAPNPARRPVAGESGGGGAPAREPPPATRRTLAHLLQHPSTAGAPTHLSRDPHAAGRSGAVALRNAYGRGLKIPQRSPPLSRGRAFPFQQFISHLGVPEE